jgi:hypothetical protein
VQASLLGAIPAAQAGGGSVDVGLLAGVATFDLVTITCVTLFICQPENLGVAERLNGRGRWLAADSLLTNFAETVRSFACGGWQKVPCSTSSNDSSNAAAAAEKKLSARGRGERRPRYLGLAPAVHLHIPSGSVDSSCLGQLHKGRPACTAHGAG